LADDPGKFCTLFNQFRQLDALFKERTLAFLNAHESHA
jgi:hypothetical protein